MPYQRQLTGGYRYIGKIVYETEDIEDEAPGIFPCVINRDHRGIINVQRENKEFLPIFVQSSVQSDLNPPATFHFGTATDG